MEKNIDVIRKCVTELKTGDVVAFIGTNLFSKTVLVLQKIGLEEKFKKDKTYKYSHVSIIVDEPWTKEKVSLESARYPFTDWDGVRIVPLKKRLMNYKGTFVLYKLNKELNDDQKNKIKEFYEKHKHKKFERSALQMVKSAFDGPLTRENKKDLSTIFCSELTAQVFINCGLLPQDKPSNEYTPSEFINSPLNDGYELIKGISFKSGINV
jgi:hypothetical protein